jgi:LPXTG-site transpeptidase (sortase) family protein
MRVVDVVGFLRRSPRVAVPLAGGAIVMACGLVLWVVAFGGNGGGAGSQPFTAVATEAVAPVPASEVDRLVIPAISVDAPVIAKVVSDDRQMADPDGPQSVVWYDFSAIPGLGGRPGGGGNSVIAGHFDYHDFGPAVFWNLAKLKTGDEIAVRLRDGSEYRYITMSNHVVDAGAAPWGTIAASTRQESVTLITCAGDFDPGTDTYTERRVVWAVRIG